MKRTIALALAITMAGTNIAPVFAAESERPISLEPNAPVIVEDVSGNKKPLEEDSVKDTPTDSDAKTDQHDGTSAGTRTENSTIQIFNEEDLRSVLSSESPSTFGILKNNIEITKPIVIPDLSTRQIYIEGSGFTISMTNLEDTSAGFITLLGESEVTFTNCVFDISKTFSDSVFRGPIIFAKNVINIKDGGGTIFDTSQTVNGLYVNVLSASNHVTVFEGIKSEVSDVNIQIKNMSQGFTLADTVAETGSLNKVWYRALGGTGTVQLVGNEVAGTVNNLAVHPTVLTDGEKPTLVVANHMGSTGKINNLVFSQELKGYKDRVEGLVLNADTGASINATVLSEDLWDLDLCKTNATYSGFYRKPSFKVEFPQVTVGSEMRVNLNIPDRYTQKIIAGTPSETYDSAYTTYEFSKVPDSTGYSMILHLHKSDKPAGSFMLSNTDLIEFDFPSETAHGGDSVITWQQKSVDIPVELTVNWTRGSIPATGFTFVFPLEDGTSTLPWYSKGKPYEVTINPETSTEVISVESKTPDILTVENGKLVPHSPGQASLVFKTDSLLKQVSLTVESSPEWEWMNAVNSIVPPITIDHAVQLKELENQLKELNTQYISSDVLEKFTKYLEDLNTAFESQPHRVVEKLIKELPQVDQVVLSHKDQVRKVKNLYDSLSPAERAKVDLELVSKLDALVEKIAKLEAQDNVIKQIIKDLQDLPQPKDITPEYRDKILDIQSRLNEIDTQAGGKNPKISDKLREKLKNALDTLNEWDKASELADKWHDAVMNLPSSDVITESSRGDLDSLVKVWDTSNEKVKYYLKSKYESDRLLLDTLYKALDLKLEEEYKKLAEEYCSRVMSVDVTNLILSQKSIVDSLAKEFDEMPSGIKQYVTEAAKSHLKELINRMEVLIAENDKQHAEEVDQQINKLPNPEDVELKDEEKINEVKNAYDSLTDAQREYISSKSKDKLNACLSEIQKLNDVKSIVDKFVEEVNALPDKNGLTPEFFEVIKKLNSQFVSFNNYALRQIPAAIKTKIVTLYSAVVELSSQEIKSATYDFHMKGMIGLSPKLEVRMPLVEGDEKGALVASKIEESTKKKILSLYMMKLTGVQNEQPWSPVTIRFPVTDFFKSYSDVGLVEYNPVTGKLNMLQPKIVEIEGTQYFEYTSDYVGYLAVVAAKKPFSWIYSFFGKRDVVSIKYSDLDHSYPVNPSKKNPVMG